jgi:F-type H+-transporting ATPase subunit b
MRFLPVIALVSFLAFLPVTSHAAADSTAAAEELKTTTPEDEASPTDPAGPAAATDEAAAPHEAAAEHGEGGLPQLNIATYPGQIFWLLVMFTVLYLAFSKSVLPAIGAVVHGRENLIKGNLDEAQRLKDQAQAIQTAYEKSLETAKFNAIQAVQNVELAAKKKASDQIDAFRRKSEGEIKSAEDRVLIVKDKAMGDMSHVAAEVASIAAEKITGVGGDLQKAKAIVDSIASKAKAA